MVIDKVWKIGGNLSCFLKIKFCIMFVDIILGIILLIDFYFYLYLSWGFYF